jgi:protein SCO1/2
MSWVRRTRMAVELLVVATCLTLLGCHDGREVASLPFYMNADLTPTWLESSASADGMHQVGDFALVDQSGDVVTDARIDGRIHIGSFFFTNCGQVCPKTIMNLKRVREALPGDDVILMSYSVMPEMDSVTVLNRFAEMHDIDGATWHLLTGDRKAIHELAENSYFVELEDAAPYDVDELFHTETVVLVDRHKRIRGVYNGTLAFDVSQLIEDARTLQAES